MSTRKRFIKHFIFLILFGNFLFFSILFLVYLVVPNFLPQQWIAIIPIVVTIGIFEENSYQQKERHRKNQIKILQSLYDEINVLIGRRKIDEIEMGPHLEFIRKGRITHHLAHKINTNFYVGSLDAEIDGKPTKEIIMLLQMIEDKIVLVNFYVNQMRDYFFNEYKKQAKLDEEYHRWRDRIKDDMIWYDGSMKNKFLRFIDEHLDSRHQSPLNEADKLLVKLKTILEKSWNIRSTSC